MVTPASKFGDAVDGLMKKVDKKMGKQNKRMEKIEKGMIEQCLKMDETKGQFNDKMKRMDDKLMILMNMISNMQDK